MNRYLIALRGQVDLDELNLSSPHHMTLVQVLAAETRLTISTDQSGCLGLLRHLHNLGLYICSMTCIDEVETISDCHDL